MEKITIPFSIDNALEVKQENQTYGRISGIGSTFNDVDRGGDRVLPGAFKESLAKNKKAGKKIKMMANHGYVIGGWNEYKETDEGLLVSGDINLEVQAGKETYALAKQEVITDLSIGYIAREFEFKKYKGEMVREIKKLDLYEVSLVTFPMNTNANILDIKSCNTITDISKFLKNYGISNKDTNEIIYHLKSFVRNDSKDEIEEKSRNELLESMDKIIQNYKINETINRSM
ncbi:MAG: HK97 family phage prohead protease [Thermoplasmatales archaeon]|nr:MAG: HK97 family phage prohead protease [Thermoplasmatales archaeon]